MSIIIDVKTPAYDKLKKYFRNGEDINIEDASALEIMNTALEAYDEITGRDIKSLILKKFSIVDDILAKNEKLQSYLQQEEYHTSYSLRGGKENGYYWIDYNFEIPNYMYLYGKPSRQTPAYGVFIRVSNHINECKLKYDAPEEADNFWIDDMANGYYEYKLCDLKFPTKRDNYPNIYYKEKYQIDDIDEYNARDIRSPKDEQFQADLSAAWINGDINFDNKAKVKKWAKKWNRQYEKLHKQEVL